MGWKGGQRRRRRRRRGYMYRIYFSHMLGCWCFVDVSVVRNGDQLIDLGMYVGTLKARRQGGKVEDSFFLV